MVKPVVITIEEMVDKVDQHLVKRIVACIGDPSHPIIELDAHVTLAFILGVMLGESCANEHQIETNIHGYAVVSKEIATQAFRDRMRRN